MLNRNRLSLEPDSVAFVVRAHYFNYGDQSLIVKKSDDSDNQKLFLLSKFCIKEFFENMPKTFTITTKNSTLHFNIDMLKSTSSVITKFVQDNPNENNYNINITDDDNILLKFEQLYQGKNIIFKEDELPLIQRFTQILNITNCSNRLKPENLATNEIDTDGNELYTSSWSLQNSSIASGIELYRRWFISFISKDQFLTFTITTNKKEYKCSIFGIYTSKVIRTILEKDATADKYAYDFDDNEDEFQLICDFFNGKKVDITSSNMDILKSIAEDLQIDCILQSVDNYINNFENVSQKLDEQQNEIDSISELSDLLYNIKELGVEKVKLSIVHSKLSKRDRYVQELAAFILQVVKPTFSLQNEMAELLIQLNKEANDDNQLDLLIPFIVKKLMTLYWPQSFNYNQGNDADDDDTEKDDKNKLNKIKVNNIGLIDEPRKTIKKNTTRTLEEINLNNRCVYSFIRILYKRGIIPKEEIMNRLKEYDLSNNALNVFFLPEIIKANPKSVALFDSMNRLKASKEYHGLGTYFMRKSVIPSNTARSKVDKSSAGLYYYWSIYAQKYLPDKIESYEGMLDSMEPDDEITRSIREDDVDKLQGIIIKEQIDIPEFKVSYNIFDDLEEDQSLINYSALYGSVKCFKYLMLNDGEIDDNTFYFSIIGNNNEIIKIVEQKVRKDEDNNNVADDNNNNNANVINLAGGFAGINSNIPKMRYININSDRSFASFWFNFNSNHMQFQLNNEIKSMSVSSNKFDDNNIQYERFTGNDIRCFLNCCNINNIIAPTIAMHKDDLFDWIFENRFVYKNKSGNDLRNIAILSALCGNAHSLIAILDKGIYITRELISCAARNGFYRLTELLLNLYDQKATENNNNNKNGNAENDDESNSNDDSFDYKSIVHFGNTSIFNLFTKYMNKSNLQQAFLHAIEVNSTSIIQFIFNNLDQFDFKLVDESFINAALKLSIRIKSSVLFDYLVDKFKKSNPESFNLKLFSNLLNQACLDSNITAVKTITGFIRNEKQFFDFTDAFFKASTSKSTEICQYFFDQKVLIDIKERKDIKELGLVDIELFEKIINNTDPNYRFLFNDCIHSAISSRNVKVIDYILKENPPTGNELFEAIQTDDIEVVNTILKYNSKPSFINKKDDRKTPLCFATEQKNIKIIKRLLSIPGIDPSLYDNNNQDPLLIAAQNQDIETIDAILNFYGDDISNNLSIVYNAIDLIHHQSYRDDKEYTTSDWEIIKKLLSVKSINPNYATNEEYGCAPLSFVYISCFDNRIDVLEFLLKLDNIDPNLYDSNTFTTPLMLCVEKKKYKFAELLIEHPKTDINMRNINGESALIMAVKNEDTEMIDKLMKDKRFDAKESRLNYAFIYSKNEVTDQLYSNENLDVNEEFDEINSTRKVNALYQSVKINDVDKIDKILQHRTFNIYKSKVNRSIFLSAENNNINVFRKLISLINHDVNIVNEERQSLLSVASRSLSSSIVDEILNNEHFEPGSVQLLEAFVQSYSNIKSDNQNNNQQQPQFHLRGRRNRFNQAQMRTLAETNQEVMNVELLPDGCSLIEMMEKILNYDKEHGQVIKFDELLPSGKSFFTAICKDFANIREVSEFLVSSGVDPNKSDKSGVYPLEHAIRINSIELVKSLVNTEKIDYTQVSSGNTYLHLAAQNKETAILSFLLEKNIIDINSVNALGDTPFMHACRKLRVDNINLLFQNENNDYLHKNKSGRDALDFFVKLKQDEKESIKQNKEKFYNKLISLINEMLDPNN